ncbi:helix-turn-helix transcriptional regulator, partial [uncultured Flavonifractor sp.]
MFADNLKTLRRARGLSQEELAGRLHVTRQTISKWENALSVPDAELLLRLAEELEVPVSRLLGGPVEEEPAPDQVAAHLAELNRLLAERNRRSRRIWRVVAGVLIG